MAMNLTKIYKGTGVTYLLKTVANGDVSKGRMGYYHQPGNPPGYWLGTGLSGLNLKAGTTATAHQAQILFASLMNPTTMLTLGKVPRRHDAVSGYDLTFTVPKSVSILWGTAPADVQRIIEQTHDDAVAAALDLIERTVATTRSGHGGVVTSPVRGLVALGFKHYETRDGDPHLHTHVAVANRVQRASDGKWLSLDGTALHAAGVMVSEFHQNYLLNLLRQRLGIGFTERTTTGTNQSFAVIPDMVGMPKLLLDAFSSRRTAIKNYTTHLIEQWREANGGAEPPRRVRDAMNLEAWNATRKPKDKVVASLAELTSRWRRELQVHGWQPSRLVRNVLHRPQTPFSPERMNLELATRLARLAIANRQIMGGEKVKVTGRDTEAYLEDHPDIIQAAGEEVRHTLSRKKATWSPYSARAEAYRLVRAIGCPAQLEEAWVNQIADAAIEQCVAVTPQRYQLPAIAVDDDRLAFNRASNFDATHLAKFTTQDILNAEDYLDSLTSTPGLHCTNEQATMQLASFNAQVKANGGHELSDDQHQAAQYLLTTDAKLVAMIGPAGTGKTTTMRALAKAHRAIHGTTVLGVAPSARAAAELRRGAGIGTDTLSKLLYENSPTRIAERAAYLRDLHAKLITTSDPLQRARLNRLIAKAETADTQYRIPTGALVIVDEASMATTHDLAALARLCDAARGKMVLSGDPLQISSVGTGGVLGRMARQGQVVELNTLHRFQEQWEAPATLRLRNGDEKVIEEYAANNRIASGDDAVMIDSAYRAVRAAQQGGRSAVLIAATNDRVAELNERATLERRATGEVNTTNTVPLRVMDAGVGEVIVARRNDRTTIATDGAAIVNSDLLQIIGINPDGSATATFVDTNRNGEQVTLSAKYLAEDCELGYAITVHRAQGITVDESHFYLPYGASLQRRLLYVALTRGKQLNRVYCALPEQAELEESHQPSWQLDDDGNHVDTTPTGMNILARVISNDGAERTAHEQIMEQTAELYSLGRLLREHDYLTHHLIAPKLADFFGQHHGQAIADEVTSSHIWEAVTVKFAQAAAHNPSRAQLVLRAPVLDDGQPPPTDADDLIRVLTEQRDHAAQMLDRMKYPDAHQRRIDAAWQRVVAASTQFGDTVTAHRNGTATSDELAHAQDRLDRARAYHLEVTSPEWFSNQLAEQAHKLELAETALKDAMPNIAAMAHWRLSNSIGERDPENSVPLPALDNRHWLGSLVPRLQKGVFANTYASADAALQNIIEQNEHLISIRIAELNTLVRRIPPTEQWISDLPGRPTFADADQDERWVQMATAVAIYRDYWNITTPTPLGADEATDADASLQQIRHLQQVKNLITQYQGHPRENQTADSREFEEAISAQAPSATANDESLRPSNNQSHYRVENQTPRTQGFSHETIEQVRAAARIEEVVARYADLQHRGAALVACCPFHDEKTPSFHVQPEKGTWHCFGACNEGGDVFSFIQKAENVRFRESVQIAADLAGIRIDNHEQTSWQPPTPRQPKTWMERRTPPPPNDEAALSRIADINQRAWQFWQQRAGRSWVPQYLAARNLTGHVTPAYAPGYNATLKHLRTQGFTDPEIIEAGLANQNSQSHPYDVFRDRMPIPYFDTKGRITGFSARANPNQPETGHKYLNTRTTPLFDKSRNLIGLTPQAVQHLQQGWKPVLCEGPLDAAAITASGARVVPLSTCGTALTPNQLGIIHDTAGTLGGLVIAFDQDAAGKQATARAATLLGPDTLGVGYATWQNAKDPGELIEQNRHNQLVHALENPIPLANAVTENAQNNTSGPASGKQNPQPTPTPTLAPASSPYHAYPSATAPSLD